MTCSSKEEGQGWSGKKGSLDNEGDCELSQKEKMKHMSGLGSQNQTGPMRNIKKV